MPILRAARELGTQRVQLLQTSAARATDRAAKRTTRQGVKMKQPKRACVRKSRSAVRSLGRRRVHLSRRRSVCPAAGMGRASPPRMPATALKIVKVRAAVTVSAPERRIVGRVLKTAEIALEAVAARMSLLDVRKTT